ncbi:sigma-70 family RNA polymerase sigma factor [Archangium gephyra]|uniref:sigma-70 family RNA polymerase sigma factor n=1 Tax=Archangium gephyra TaxID=48 RepID=UPI0035D4CFD8
MWPEIKLDPEQFASHAEACRQAGGAAPEHLADLYLAFAAARGHAAALRLLDERLLSGIEPAVRRVDSTPAFLDEVRQVLRLSLLVGTEDAPPRLMKYKGSGPLLSWVRVAATRVALKLKSAEGPPASAEDLLGELMASEPDPEVSHLKTLYRAEFGEALRAALAALPERQRALLRLHYVEGLRLAQLGTLYGVHQSTASRWVAHAAHEVATDTRRRLVKRLALSPASLDSIARLVQSNLDVSIRRILGGADAP